MGKGLILLLLALISSGSWAAQRPAPSTYLPDGARLYAPLLAQEQARGWAAMPEPWTLAGLVEQESCVSLRSKYCWNPHAELKTSREYGFGFGQVTVAYNAAGGVRFNKFQELQARYPSLRSWSWADRFDPAPQLLAIVEMNHGLWDRVPAGATAGDRLSFMLSSYNGGVAALLQDCMLCSHTAGCDSQRWFGNVEQTSFKSKVPQVSYGGQSWFSVNRGYVRNVMLIRRDKYRVFWSP